MKAIPRSFHHHGAGRSSTWSAPLRSASTLRCLWPHSRSHCLASASTPGSSPLRVGGIETRAGSSLGFKRSCGLAAATATTTTTPRFFSTDSAAKKDASKKAPPFAFAFDIDGVLLHVAKPIPGATETLSYLQQHNIPFILLTNGGGKHEAERVADLSSKLSVPLSTDNFVQSHTPFQELVHGSSSSSPSPGGAATAEALRDKNILITGSNAAKSRAIAEQYGFRNVITPADILAAHPTIWPFEPLMESIYASTARPLPTPQPKIDAIFVFNDPRDWALDIQIILDLLQSRDGVLGTYSARNGRADLENHGWQTDGQPPLFFSNPDLVWSAEYRFPRFGQGAFQAACAGVWDQVTGGTAPLRRTTIGKPYRQTYAYAERVLGAHRAQILGLGGGGDDGAGDGDGADPEKEKVREEKGESDLKAPLRTVYMVGDNPESDIRGANEYVSPVGTKWTSVLVRTGVWSPERGEPRHRPAVVVDDVRGAVGWALRREGWV